MKKVSIKFISILISFSLLLGLCNVALLGEATTMSIPLLSLGDSIATGYKLANYDPTDLTKAKDSYVNLLGVTMNIVPVNLAKDGMTSSQLLLLLEDEAYVEQLSSAKVITVSIGGNNILKPMMASIKNEFGLTEDATNDMLAEKFTEVGYYASIPKAQTAITSAKVTIEAGVDAFEVEFPKIVSALLEKAPQARILISTLYNPYGGVKLSGLDLNAAVEVPIQNINTVITQTLTKTEYIDAYEIVDVAKAFGVTPMTSKYVNVSFSPFDVDPHPAMAGHEVIFGLYANLIVDDFTSYYFTDIQNHKAEDSIRYLAGLGVISGKGNNLFDPNGHLTRSEFVKILFGAVEGANIQQLPSINFTDLEKGKWYIPYIDWAVINGVTQGIKANEFGPNVKITRQDLATMIYRYYKKSGYIMPEIDKSVIFKDDAQIKDYAKEAVYTLKAAGFIIEKSGENFNPTIPATRGEATMMLANYARLIRANND